MDERVVETEVPVYRLDILEMREATESPRDLGWVALGQKRSATDVKGLADDRRGLQKLPIGRQELVQASADRRLHGDGKGGAGVPSCS